MWKSLKPIGVFSFSVLVVLCGCGQSSEIALDDELSAEERAKQEQLEGRFVNEGQQYLEQVQSGGPPPPAGGPGFGGGGGGAGGGGMPNPGGRR